MMPFQIKTGGARITLSGVACIGEEGGKDYISCDLWNPYRDDLATIWWKNGVIIEGEPGPEVDLKLFEVVRDGSKWVKLNLSPFFQKNGVKKFTSRNTINVVIAEKNGQRMTYIISWHQFPTGLVVFDAGRFRERRENPAEHKPLVQHIDIATVDKDNGHGEESQIANPDPKDIAGKQLDHGNAKNGGQRHARA